MSKLQDLKKAAADKLATVPADVMTYVTALESKVKLNSGWIIGGFAVGLGIGWFIGRYL